MALTAYRTLYTVMMLTHTAVALGTKGKMASRRSNRVATLARAHACTRTVHFYATETRFFLFDFSVKSTYLDVKAGTILLTY